MNAPCRSNPPLLVMSCLLTGCCLQLHVMQNNSNHPDEAWLVDTLRQGDPLLTPTPQLKNYTNSTVRQLTSIRRCFV